MLFYPIVFIIAKITITIMACAFWMCLGAAATLVLCLALICIIGCVEQLLWPLIKDIFSLPRYNKRHPVRKR